MIKTISDIFGGQIYTNYKTTIRLLCVQHFQIIPAMTNCSYTALVLPLCRRLNQEIVPQPPINGVIFFPFGCLRCLHKRRQT